MEPKKVKPIIVADYESKENPSKLGNLIKKKKEPIAKKKKSDSKKENSTKDRILLKTTSKIPLLQNKEEGIIRKNGVMDILQKETADLYTLKENHLKLIILADTKFLRAVNVPHKLVAINLPPSTTEQQGYWYKKMNATDSPVIKQICEKKLYQLQFVEKERVHREFYYFIFAKNFEELKETRNRALRLNNKGLKLYTISLEKKEQVLYQLNNQNSKL